MVLVGILIGVLILTVGLDEPDENTEAAVTATTQEEAESEQEETEPGSQSTTPPGTPSLRPPEEVRVLVANGSGIQGAAGRLTDRLNAASYLTLSPRNTVNTQTASIIYFMPTYGLDAVAIAGILDADAESLIRPLPSPVPSLVGGIEDAQILILLGGPDDLARTGQ